MGVALALVSEDDEEEAVVASSVQLLRNGVVSVPGLVVVVRLLVLQ